MRALSYTGEQKMNQYGNPDAKKAVRLYEDLGATSRLIDVEMTDDGNLVVFGYDVGNAPRRRFGHGGYEFRITGEAGQKDHLLLALIEKCFGKRFSAVDDFHEFVGLKEIPVSWKTY